MGLASRGLGTMVELVMTQGIPITSRGDHCRHILEFTNLLRVCDLSPLMTEKRYSSSNRLKSSTLYCHLKMKAVKPPRYQGQWEKRMTGYCQLVWITDVEIHSTPHRPFCPEFSQAIISKGMLPSQKQLYLMPLLSRMLIHHADNMICTAISFQSSIQMFVPFCDYASILSTIRLWNVYQMPCPFVHY